MEQTRHRGGLSTEEKYGGIPVHAAPGVHEAAAEALRRVLPTGAHVADLGAGHGAFAQRLADAGFRVTAFDLDCSDWKASGALCRQCDLNGPLEAVAADGPYDAICALEMLDHLENPRGFLRELVQLKAPSGAWLVVTLPNPLDTFSCIAMFTRGIFSWAGPAQYRGGGHINVLPHWMVEAHLQHLGVTDQDWRFLAPYRHPSTAKRLIYRVISALRRALTRNGDRDYIEGQTAMVVARL